MITAALSKKIGKNAEIEKETAKEKWEYEVFKQKNLERKTLSTRIFYLYNLITHCLAYKDPCLSPILSMCKPKFTY